MSFVLAASEVELETGRSACSGRGCIICGNKPEAAQALVGLGVDLSDLPTTGTLKTALELCTHRRRGAGQAS